MVATSHPKRFLLTFGRSYNTLALARSLTAAGHTVMICDSMRLPIARFSDSVSKYFHAPRPRLNPRDYCRKVVKICHSERIDVVIPMHEETEILAQVKHRFPSHTAVFTSSFDVDDHLHNKFSFQQLLTSLDIPTAKYALVSTEADLKNLDFTTPFALKAAYSRGSMSVFKAKPGHLNELPDLEFDPMNPWIAQEWLDGERFCTYSVCHEGVVTAHSAYPVEFTMDGNSCVTFRNVEHQSILEWVQHFVAKIGYTGQIAFDFFEQKDGQLFVIECNPRSTSGIMLFEPGTAIDRAFIGDTNTLVTPKIGASRQIGVGMLLYGWRRKARNGASVRAWFNALIHTPDVIVENRDLKPVFALPLAFANIWSSSKRDHVSLAEGFMFDHEWDGTALTVDQ